MTSRRDFLKAATLLAAGGGASSAFAASIQRAFSIEPAPGSTYLDAEHVVILMQENRSFDHAFGSLRGVRGFDDPRAMTLPDGNPVWLQTSAAGETYAPFRMDIKASKATWMGSLPHGWVDQANARNHGKHNGWIDAKACSNKDYAHLPLTLGFYTREDIPFYYAFADAFTICDQNFCSSLTATEPNRLHFWTGTVRPRQSAASKAYVLNEDMGYDLELDWMTFPERLEEHGVSWRIYQNEISLPSGLTEDEDAWLSNFDDNPLEYFVTYRVRFSRSRRAFLEQKRAGCAEQIRALEGLPAPLGTKDQTTLAALQKEQAEMQHEWNIWNDEAFDALPDHAQNIHRKAFTTNAGDSAYRELTSLTFRDGETEREMQVPKGDVLHQFREDVRTGQLPTVSWLVPPERFSDHPSSPWYGAWYLSETLDILTHNPEVWKKTIFILCYDENDGYFDHVPPFVPPRAGRAETGAASPSLDTAVEFVSPEQEAAIREKDHEWLGQPGPIGLGFRVPLIIASPWSRGGYVCSEVFDHTSMLQFLETFVSHRSGRDLQETNISAWRRSMCGDLSSAFRPYTRTATALPDALRREPFFQSIYDAQFQPIPTDYRKLSLGDIAAVRRDGRGSPLLPRQEKGVRPACALPYELSVVGTLSDDGKALHIRFSAGRAFFGQRSAGAPFRVYTNSRVRPQSGSAAFEAGRAWDFAVAAGESVTAQWPLDDFENASYQLAVHGPNGFFREFSGASQSPLVHADVTPVSVSGTATHVQLVNRSSHPVSVVIDDLSYGAPQRIVQLEAAGEGATGTLLSLDLKSSHGWYDLRLRVVNDSAFECRLAGHIESGRESFSDPAMGSLISA